MTDFITPRDTTPQVLTKLAHYPHRKLPRKNGAEQYIEIAVPLPVNNPTAVDYKISMALNSLSIIPTNGTHVPNTSAQTESKPLVMTADNYENLHTKVANGHAHGGTHG